VTPRSIQSVVLCVAVSALLFGQGCSGHHAAEATGVKLKAFQKIVAMYRETPAAFADPAKRDSFNTRLQRLQDDFAQIPFDAAKQRDEALQIVILFETEIQNRYSGELHRTLENQVGEIASELAFSR